MNHLFFVLPASKDPLARKLRLRRRRQESLTQTKDQEGQAKVLKVTEFNSLQSLYWHQAL